MIEKTQVPKRRVKHVGFYQQLILYGVEHSVYFYELVVLAFHHYLSFRTLKYNFICSHNNCAKSKRGLAYAF